MCVVCICLLPSIHMWAVMENEIILSSAYESPHNIVYFKQTDQYLQRWGCMTPTSITPSDMQVGSLKSLEAINKLKDEIGNKSHNIFTL